MPEPIQPYEKVSKRLKTHEIIINNFLGGIMWALGATLGISLVFTILGIIAKNINLVPIVGAFASDILNFILATNPNLNK